jgi:hypothetical protein
MNQELERHAKEIELSLADYTPEQQATIRVAVEEKTGKDICYVDKIVTTHEPVENFTELVDSGQAMVFDFGDIRVVVVL